MKKSRLTDVLEQIDIHDHLCLIYETREEQFEAAIPFICIGLLRGEKCVYIADENTAENVLRQMDALGISSQEYLARGALVIASKNESYLRSGFFDPDAMIAFLHDTEQEALRLGFTALRVTGEMTWALGGDPGAERLIEYENKLNLFFPTHRCLGICQYNRSRFGAEVIRDIIYTHPLVIYGGAVCENFYYIPPEEFNHPDREAKMVSRFLNTLRVRAQEAIAREDDRGQELAWLNLLHTVPTTTTAQIFGTQPLKEAAPETFTAFANRFKDALMLSLEERAYKIEHNVSMIIQSIAYELGAINAMPRDIIDIYMAAVGSTHSRLSKAAAAEGRLRVLELMGYLAAHYRRCCLGSRVTAYTQDKETTQ